MKRIALLISLTVLLLTGDAIAHQKEHLSLKDTFWGNEDDFQVCYPKDHRTYFYVIIAFGLFSTTMGAWIIILKTQNNKILQEKNKVIEEKNRDLIGSIEYAKRIQYSILPGKAYLDSLSVSHFVLYQPKDIVSGDFYWVYEENNLLYTAVIDCTGHGVPGALLSLIGYNALTKAIKEDCLTTPSDILNKMNTYVKTTLKQESDGEIKDGMEIALCCLNKGTLELQYAGANLSLWVAQNGTFNQIKATRCTVGSVQDHVKQGPANNILQLQKNDMYFMFTDGFQDQFGGVNNKKYTSGALRSFLQQNSSKTMEQQKELLMKEFSTWKGNNQQVDDVCVMGVKA